jgi:hypothetical protein
MNDNRTGIQAERPVTGIQRFWWILFQPALA